MGLGIWELVLILLIVVVIFGAGKLPKVMGDVGKGIRNLKDGLKTEGEQPNSELKKPELSKSE
jgi:sec-independent protein translocase protein TatA